MRCSILRACAQVPSRTTTHSGRPAGTDAESSGKRSQAPWRSDGGAIGSCGRPWSTIEEFERALAASRPVLVVFHDSRTWRTMKKRVRVCTAGTWGQMQATRGRKQLRQRPAKSGGVNERIGP
jgi:hypothetical protein